MSRQLLTNFSRGELSPEMRARIDTPQYSAGAKTVVNFLIHKTGGLVYRPGFRFVAEADDVETPIRYVPFTLVTEQSFVLTFGDASMRALAYGGVVLEENLRITAISKEIQAKITSPYHDLSVGDRIYFFGNVGMVEINGQTGTVTEVLGDDEYRVDIDTRTYGTFTSSDGTLRVGAPPPPTPTPPPPPPPPSPPPTPPVGGGGGAGGGGGGTEGEWPPPPYLPRGEVV